MTAYHPKVGEIVRATITSSPMAPLVSAVRVYEGEFKNHKVDGVEIDSIFATMKRNDRVEFEPLGYRQGAVALVTVSSMRPLEEGMERWPPISRVCTWFNGAWRDSPNPDGPIFGQPALGSEFEPDPDLQVDVYIVGMLP